MSESFALYNEKIKTSPLNMRKIQFRKESWWSYYAILPYLQ